MPLNKVTAKSQKKILAEKLIVDCRLTIVMHNSLIL